MFARQRAVDEHVPAWKRLGLKLKGQNDSPEEDAENESHQPLNSISLEDNTNEAYISKPQQATEKRKRDIEESTSEHLTKKKKKRKSESREELNLELDETSTGLTISSEGHDEPHVTQPSTKTKRSSLSSSNRHLPNSEDQSTSPRKSVSFSADTKTDDGSSAQDLYRTWSDSQQQGEYGLTPEEIEKYLEPGSLPTRAHSDSPSPEVSHQPHDRLSTKKAKKAARHQDKASTGSEPYLQYLTTYATDRGNWKFNKSLQTTLLKHAFNIHRVPVTMESALLAYIAGLQGASAKSRLRGSAQEIIASSASIQASGPMSAQEVRDAAHDAALAERLLNEKKRRRAETILFTVGAEPAAGTGSQAVVQRHNGTATAQPQGTLVRFDDAPLPPVATQSQSQTPGQPRSRRKKRRTDVSSSSESESDSSSESSSDDSDSDVEMPERIGDAPKKVAALPLPRAKAQPVPAGESGEATSPVSARAALDTDENRPRKKAKTEIKKPRDEIPESAWKQPDASADIIRAQLFGAGPPVTNGVALKMKKKAASSNGTSATDTSTSEEESDSDDSSSSDSDSSSGDSSSDDSSDSE